MIESNFCLFVGNPGSHCSCGVLRMCARTNSSSSKIKAPKNRIAIFWLATMTKAPSATSNVAKKQVPFDTEISSSHSPLLSSIGDATTVILLLSDYEKYGLSERVCQPLGRVSDP
jgi:hypothetical protein